MEFGVLRGLIDTKSYLSMDDIHGPGSFSYKKLTNIPSCDFALYKIQSYALCDLFQERKKFVSELGLTIEQLGNKAEEFIIPLLTSIVLFL